MVFAFMCHSLTTVPVRILHSAVYGEDMFQSLSESIPVESYREIRKEQLLAIGCRVQSEYGYRTSAKDLVPRGHIRDDSTDSSHSFERGWFRLSANDPYPTAKNVLWQVHDNCAFVFICELDENKLQAENILTLIMQYLCDHVMNLEQKMAELMLKGEWVSAVLHVYIPNGQLVFMNYKLVKQKEKQLESIIISK